MKEEGGAESGAGQAGREDPKSEAFSSFNHWDRTDSIMRFVRESGKGKVRSLSLGSYIGSSRAVERPLRLAGARCCCSLLLLAAAARCCCSLLLLAAAVRCHSLPLT